MRSAPHESIVRAAARWLNLLRTSSVGEARAILRSNPEFSDFTQTQYEASLEWLEALGLVSDGRSLIAPLEELGPATFRAALEWTSPTWLADADLYVQTQDDIPIDVLDLAQWLDLSPSEAHQAIRRMHGKVDTAFRTEVGLAGEQALVRILEAAWPERVRHESLTDDGLGYDITVWTATGEWHLEVKTTTRRGRLVIYISRNEYETALSDPRWRLIVVALGDDKTAWGIAHVDLETLRAAAPLDQAVSARWESFRIDLSPTDLRVPVHFFGAPSSGLASVLAEPDERALTFSWFPEVGSNAGSDGPRQAGTAAGLAGW